MTGITNESEFRQSIKGLDYNQQHVLAAKFVEHVLDLCSDKRIADVVRIAAEDDKAVQKTQDQYRILSEYIAS